MALTKEQRRLNKEYVKYLNAELDVDREMIKDCVKNYQIPEVDYRGKVCLDLGANIGGFSKVAIDNGAYMSFAVECNPRNFEKINYSFRNELRFKGINAAVSGSSEDEITFYSPTREKGFCSGSLNKRRGAGWNDLNEIVVKNVNIETLLNTYQPDIVKIDIEGSEYSILSEVLNYNPDFLFIELHAGKSKNLMEPTLNELRENYQTYNIEPVIVFKSVAGYDCWFKK